MKNKCKLVYYRVYYCLFFALKRSFREDNKTVAFITVIYFSTLLFANTFSLLLLATAITKERIYQMPLIWLLIVFTVLNTILFMGKQRYLKIIDLFKNEETAIKKQRKTLCAIYVVISLVAVPALLFLVGTLGLYGFVP